MCFGVSLSLHSVLCAWLSVSFHIASRDRFFVRGPVEMRSRTPLSCVVSPECEEQEEEAVREVGPGDEGSEEDTPHVICHLRPPEGPAVAYKSRASLSSEVLKAQGWTRRETSGRHSYVFTRGYRVMKIVRDGTLTKAEFCRTVQDRLLRLDRILRILGRCAPVVHYAKVCDWNDHPAMVIVMRHAGSVNRPVPGVSDAHVARAAERMCETNVFSLDLYTDSGRVNTGNLAFALVPARGGVLNIRFLDVDETHFFVSTDRAEEQDMRTMWKHIIRRCLHMPTDPFDWSVFERIRCGVRPLDLTPSE